ncbi:GroES-like protein [Mycena alexandri]|uniref:GroES-like protein n=1 Tax=Mycena alexandri TaxID=1745969 RepID=A0AAD6TGM0_9AGAR|nr:GroES-like protein [Mycena alexandri]
MPTQQQAIVVEAPKGPFVLRPRLVPTPAEGEVLIKIMSAGLNPINWKQGAFNILIGEYPAVVGHDVAGIVEELGKGVEGLKKGDRVFAQTFNGGFQQYVAVPAAIVIPIPDNTSFDEATTFPVAFSTACVGLFASGPIGLGLNPTFSWDKPQQGQAALVIGGGQVGQFAIQLLKFAGFTRIVAYASKANFDYLGQLGATECIDRSEVPVESLAAHPALASRVSVVYDAGYVSSFNAAYDALVEGGKVVITRPAAKLERDPEQKKLTLVRVQGYYAGPDVTKIKPDVVGYLASPEHTVFGKLLIKNLPDMLAKGAVSGNRYEVLPNGLAGILEGLDRLRQGGVSAFKLVAHPQDPIA